MAPPLGGGSQHFSLSWERYQKVMCDGFSNLQQTGEFVDMTIAADGHLVKVHRMLVSLASPYLRELIQSAPCPHPVIFLNNISHQILSSILEYVYTGEVAVPAEKLTTFIETAKALHIRGLEDMMTMEQHPTTQVEYHLQPEPVQSKPSHTLQIQVVGNKPEISTITMPQTARNVIVRQDVFSLTPEMKSKKDDLEYMETTESGTEIADTNDDPFDVETEVPHVDTHHHGTTTAVKTGVAASQTELQYTVSNRGALQLILNRYMYNLSSRSRNGRMRRWKCVDYRNHKCPATATTEDNAIISRIAMHNHPFHDKKIVTKIERKAVFSAIVHAEEATKSIRENNTSEPED